MRSPSSSAATFRSEMGKSRAYLLDTQLNPSRSGSAHGFWGMAPHSHCLTVPTLIP